MFAQKSAPIPDDQQLRFDIAFVNGNKEKILENYEEAIKYFLFCYKIDPNNAALNFVLGECYLEQKQAEQAEHYVSTAIKIDKQNTWYKELLVDIYIARKKNKEAAKLLVEIARLKQDADYLLKAAYVYTMMKDFKSALKCLNEVEKNVGINEEIVSRKEQIYLAQNQVDKAIAEIKKLIAAFPDEPKYKGMLADLYWANGNSEAAVAIYQEILRQNPQNGFALFAMADYAKSKNQLEEWYAYLKKGMASSDVDVKSKINVLSGFIAGNEFGNQIERTFELAKIFSDTHPTDITAFLVLGDVYAKQQKFDSARLEYRKALKIEPATYIAWQQSVFCSSQLLNNQYLLEDCEGAIEYFPNESAFYVYAAVAAAQLKQYDKAILHANAGLQVTTPDQEDIIQQLNATLADVYHYAKNYKASDSIYNELLKKDPNNAYALNNYAYFLSLRKAEIEKAETMSKKSLELDAENPSYLDTYGWILFVKGDYTNAKINIERALQLSPNSAEVVDHLGDVLYKLGDVKGAKANWEKAKTLGSENPVLDKKIKEGKWYE